MTVDSWLRIELSYAVFAVEYSKGIVTKTPPIAKWMKGKRIDYIKDWVRTKKGKTLTMAQKNRIVIGDSFKLYKKIKRKYDLVLLDPDYNDPDMIYRAIGIALSTLRKDNGAVLCFMYPEDVRLAGQELDQVCHWIKTPGSRNTKKRYSRFIEAICVWHGGYFNQNLSPATRTGIFTDTHVRKHKHPYRKPFSLIEKLVLLHCPPGGRVVDLFGGTMVTHDVCVKHGFSSLCIDKVDWRK